MQDSKVLADVGLEVLLLVFDFAGQANTRTGRSSSICRTPVFSKGSLSAPQSDPSGQPRPTWSR
eukprot:113535-Rhodomonas_salina.1